MYPSSLKATKRVYLDVCALCRPFDDQTQMRIRMETEAVQLILSNARSGNLVLVVSPVHDIEIGAIGDPVEQEHLLSMLAEMGSRVTFDLPAVRRRAEEWATRQVGSADAAHLAFAEAAQAHFVTCDDRLIRQCRRVQVTVWCGDPVAFCVEEDLR
jgi:predicted nucleic acid-binding protein